MLDILAVLVVVFADVAEVRREGLDSQGTWDLPAFPLNDDTCHRHTYQHNERQRRRPSRDYIFPDYVVTRPTTRQGRGKGALLDTREAARLRLVIIHNQAGLFILSQLQRCFAH